MGTIMIFEPDRAKAAYFGAVLACSHTDTDTPDEVADAVEAAAVDAYLAAYAEAAAELPQPMTFIDLAEARSRGYDAAREAAQAAYSAHTAPLQLAA
jgi:hypothetical protein